MKQILENWNRFLNESNEISIDVEGGNIFGVVHTDSHISTTGVINSVLIKVFCRTSKCPLL